MNMKNDTNKDDWFMKDSKWYVIGSSFIMPLVLLTLWVLIMSSILFGL